ncbi:hypothetical protein GOV13_01425 [Candidatus Pacearchaeota archaeon]|nr:hypothetical protein [Candidatus Pacearchaeota archaeon]
MGLDNTKTYQIVAEFMNKYERSIKPYLEEGKLDEIKFLIGEVCLRGRDVVEQDISPMEERGAYAKYRMALTELMGLFSTEEMTDELLELSFNSLERHAEDLDLILHKNPKYKQFREN